MTVEVLVPSVTFTIDGIGPYSIQQPYAAGSIVAIVLSGTTRTELAPADVTVTPAESAASGDLFLSPAAAAAHAGADLVIERRVASILEQGWAGIGGAREKSLELQLDQIVMAVQEQAARIDTAVRFDTGAADPVVPVPDSVLTFDADGRPATGLSIAEVAAAAANAAAAAADRAAAEAAASAAAAAADAAQAAENALLEWKGPWTTATAYAPSDIVRETSGDSYVCLVAHTSGTFLTDLGLGYWQLFVPKGAAGAGSGDVLAVNAGSEYVPVARAFRNNISAMVRAISKRTGINLATEASAIDSSIYNLGTGNTNLPAGAGDGDSLVSSKIDATTFNYLVLGNARAWLGRRVANTLAWTELATRAYAEGLVGSVLHARDQKPSGTHGGTATAGAYAQRTLNVLASNAIAGASLAGNRITLPAGTYHVRASVPGVECGAHKAKVFNVTAGADLIVGQAARALTNSTVGTIAEVAGVITLAVTSQIELQHRVTANRSAIGLGLACGFGDVEVYSEILITRLA